MSELPYHKIEENLGRVLEELRTKKIISKPGFLSYEDSLKQLDEWINFVNEYEIAYESIVCLLETETVEISGNAAIRLLEVALLLGYKTDKSEDKAYDLRPRLSKLPGSKTDCQ